MFYRSRGLPSQCIRTSKNIKLIIFSIKDLKSIIWVYGNYDSKTFLRFNTHTHDTFPFGTINLCKLDYYRGASFFW
ncbi:hypothetical protein ANABIO32_13060 [Rossellomorea marisflavi]|nr:hypothetical protein ANABIO32_13060 [Rossellomorea marisflavi]